MQLTAILLLACVASSFADLKHAVTVSDHKAWKKLLKTRTNVLALFASGQKQVGDFLSVYDRVAGKIMGKGTLVFLDCAKDSKKLCKTLKVKPEPFMLKHYKDGSFNKDYDRLLQEKSLRSFMENPTADPPWSEDPTAGDVRHIEGPNDFERLLKKEKKPILAMFYAPWCGHCKRLKPEYAEAASELKGKAVLAGMDTETPDAYGIRQEFNISGYPTLVYFERGVKKFEYSGGRDKESILEWMKDPKEAQKPQEEETPWSEIESDVVHLSDDMFDAFLGENPSVLVMFYAPWCGHCKAMKPHFMEAAATMKEEGIEGTLAAVDATKETQVAERFEVKGYPAVKYFKDGKLAFDYGFARSTEGLLDFMKEPREPPPPEPDWTEVENEVNHLTDEDFKSFLKKKKHALVMFYAPWCGHCKAAKPEYIAAAEQFSEEKKTAFAAINCAQFRTLCRSHEVAGYPTFKYFNYGKNEYKYNGHRDEAGFVEFMAEPTAFTRTEL